LEQQFNYNSNQRKEAEISSGVLESPDLIPQSRFVPARYFRKSTFLCTFSRLRRESY